MNNEYQILIDKALNFPIDEIVKRYAKDHNLPISIAKEHSKEVLKFLILCAINPQAGYGMSTVIDEFWHTFIFFTRDYHKFCREIAGRYIHHAPNSEEETKSGYTLEHYLRTIEDYQRIFCEEAPTYLWPRPTLVEAGSDCSGKGCGDNTCSSGGCSQCNFLTEDADELEY